jgi:membrane protein YqaA with SNARE-associated domain
MSNTQKTQMASSIGLSLWALALFSTSLVAVSQVPGVSEIVKVADIAREKDIVWLSMVTTIVATLYSAWLNWRKDKQNEAITSALVESAKATQQMANAVEELRGDLNVKR